MYRRYYLIFFILRMVSPVTECNPLLWGARIDCIAYTRGENINQSKNWNPVALKTHHQHHRSVPIVANPRRLATKQAARVSASSLASVDSGFVGIGHLQVLAVND